METMGHKVRERFWNKVQITHPEKCWYWIASLDNDKYGKFAYKSKNISAHRFSFYLMNGYYPPVVRHTCDTPTCVNPYHLQAGTQQENCLDTVERGRHKNAAKTACHKGHEFTKENTYLYPSGRRDCRACRKERQTDRLAL